MRDAGGGEEVRAKVRALFGVDARAISGDEEARLTYEGALSGLAVRGVVVRLRHRRWQHGDRRR